MTNLISSATSRVMGWFAGREQGQGMLEYALILGMIVVAIIAAFAFFDLGDLISGIFSKVDTAVSI